MAKVILFLNFMLLICFYNMFQTIYGEHETLGGLSLKIVHWNSPELPTYKPNRTHEEMTNELIDISRDRIKAFKHHLYALNTTQVRNSNPIRPTLEKLPSSVLLVHVGIGTFHTNPPFQTNYLALDMAFSHTWTQCEGCSPCFDQRGPRFPWHHSITYHQAPRQSDGHVGITRVPYADGFIEGHESFDTFTFQSTNGFVKVPNVRFLCVLNSRSYPDGVESGMFSLSRQGYSSFMSSVHDTRINNGMFSYCLPPLNEPTQHPIYLRFGHDIRPVTYALTAPLYHSPIPGNLQYYVRLIDIKVGRQRLWINHQIFALKPNGFGGCVLDLGTPFTTIPRVVYNQLELVLATQYERKNWRQVQRVLPSPISDFSFCYRPLSHEIPISPPISFLFENNVYITVAEPMGSYNSNIGRLYCLQIFPVDIDLTVIGAWQQVNHRIIYDTRNSVLHMYPEACRESS